MAAKTYCREGRLHAQHSITHLPSLPSPTPAGLPGLCMISPSRRYVLPYSLACQGLCVPFTSPLHPNTPTPYLPLGALVSRKLRDAGALAGPVKRPAMVVAEQVARLCSNKCPTAHYKTICRLRFELHCGANWLRSPQHSCLQTCKTPNGVVHGCGKSP